MAELVDALDSNSNGLGRAGSIPALGTRTAVNHLIFSGSSFLASRIPYKQEIIVDQSVKLGDRIKIFSYANKKSIGKGVIKSVVTRRFIGVFRIGFDVFER